METLSSRHTDENPLLTAVQLWLETATAKGVSPRTLRNYRELVEPFVTFLHQQGCTSLEDVTAHHIRRWLLYRQQQGISTHTLHNSYRVPKTFWRWCVREELTQHNPFLRVDPPKRAKVVKTPLTPEEVQRMLDACNGKHWIDMRNKALMLCLVTTGLRAAEACSLTVGHTAGETCVITGKGNKQRVVVLPPDLRLALQRYLRALQQQRGVQLDATSPLWWSSTGRPLTLEGLKLTVRKIGAKVGLKIGSHCLRRSFGTWCVVNGMNLHLVQRLLGHADARVTMLYLGVSEKDLVEAYRRHNPMKNLFKGGGKR